MAKKDKRAESHKTHGKTHLHTNRLPLFMILAMAAFLLPIMSCTGLQRPKGGIVAIDFHKGTSAVELSFLRNTPPSEIIAPAEGQTSLFQVGVMIENKGAYTVKDGYILLGLEPNYMRAAGWDIADREISQIGASGEKVGFTLRGKNQFDPSGQAIVAVADVEALPLERQSVTHKSSVILTACYDYETFASQRICIDTDVYGLKPIEKTCTAQDISLSGGQGAPVSVDLIEISMLPDGKEFVKPHFVIHISNKGRGTVFRPDRVRQACSPTPLSPDDINTILLDEVEFSGFTSRAGHIECSEYLLKLRDNKARVVCTMKPGIISTGLETYATSLNIRLKYGYSSSISKHVVMNRP